MWEVGRVEQSPLVTRRPESLLKTILVSAFRCGRGWRGAEFGITFLSTHLYPAGGPTDLMAAPCTFSKVFHTRQRT